MKKITTLANVLTFSPAQEWYQFLQCLLLILQTQVQGHYPNLKFKTELLLESISVKRGKAAVRDVRQRDRISLRVKRSKVGLRIVFMAGSREADSKVQLWFLGENGSRTGKGDSLEIPRENLGTEEFIRAAGDWLTELRKPDAKRLGGKFI